MKIPSLGEFEELVLLTVAAQHNEAYGVSKYFALINSVNFRKWIFSIDFL